MQQKRPLLGVGIALIVLGGYLIAITLTPPGYIKVVGRIVDEDFSQGTARSKLYKKTIGFTTREGNYVTVENYTNTYEIRTSNEVGVAYSPSDPKQIVVESDSFSKRFWGTTILLGGVALLFLHRKRARG